MSPEPVDATVADEEMWRGILLGSEPGLKVFRRLFGSIPSNPRCKMCAAPFGGVGGAVMNVAWHRNARSKRNPLLCTACSGTVRNHPGGAQIDVSILFADVRGSTSLAEELSPRDFRNQLEAFYHVAWDAITTRDGVVDKFLGDGVMALFIPGFAGEGHAARAVDAGRALLSGIARLPVPRLPVGAGVHSGTAYVGVVANEEDRDFSALGDAVNVAARLGSIAAAGELLVSADAARAAVLPASSGEPDRLELKGRREQVEVIRIAVS